MHVLSRFEEDLQKWNAVQKLVDQCGPKLLAKKKWYRNFVRMLQFHWCSSLCCDYKQASFMLYERRALRRICMFLHLCQNASLMFPLS